MTILTKQNGIGVVAVIAAGIVIVILAATQTAETERTEALTDDTVVATLQSRDEAMPADLQEKLRASRSAPEDVAKAKLAARALIDEGRLAGDSRLVGAAIAILRNASQNPDAEILFLEATARQYQHDFEGALVLLDRAHAIDPDDINVLLTRATVTIVQGKLAEAQRDCSLIAALNRPDVGFLCQATALLPSVEGPMIAARLTDIIARRGQLDPALHNWATSLIGEIAVYQGDDAIARQHFETVLGADPDALRERLMLADLMLRTGDAAAVPDLLKDAPSVDGVLIRRVIAFRALGQDDEARDDLLNLSIQIDQNLSISLTAHAREETMYFLSIADNPAMALERATVNWMLQKEIEDAQLLIDAAVASGQPDAAQPVLDWLEAEAVVVPALRMPVMSTP